LVISVFLKKLFAIARNVTFKNDACLLELLKAHTSTNERLSIVQEMYFDIFKKCKKVSSILDLGAGLNPIYIPFVPELQNKKYLALDVNNNTTALLNKFFIERNISGEAVSCDILSKVPNEHYDIVFMFKILPLLEKQKKNAAINLINSLDAKYIVITFPTKTVSGRDVNMEQNYTNYFLNLANSNKLKIIFEKNYSNEAVFIIEKI